MNLKHTEAWRLLVNKHKKNIANAIGPSARRKAWSQYFGACFTPNGNWYAEGADENGKYVNAIRYRAVTHINEWTNKKEASMILDWHLDRSHGPSNWWGS